MTGLLLRSVAIAAVLVVGSPRLAAADDDRTPKELFSAGNKAFHAGDYRTAAEAFEEAYRKKPHHDSLWNAARAWHKAGENARAANLYAKYLREAPVGTQDRDAATTALADLSTKLGRIVVPPTAITDVRIDGIANERDGVFVPPGDHVVGGQNGTTPVRKTVTLAAGQTLSVTLEPPPPPPPAPAPKSEPPPPPPKQESFKMPWVVVAVGGALTLAGAGLTVWSGLDTNAQRERFDRRFVTKEANQEDLDDGRSSQLRTNVLLGATIGVAALTAVAAIFVDWSGGSKRGGLFVQPALGYATAGYRY